MEPLPRNIQQAMRRLRRSPGFVVAVILTLALGIGANTALFSVVYGVLLKPLRFPQPAQLVAIKENVEPNDRDIPVNANHFIFWQSQVHSFSGIAALRVQTTPLGGQRPEEIGVAEITINLFSVLRVQPRLGRAFLPSEGTPGRNDTVVLTDGLWKRSFASDPNIAGKSITLDGKLYRVAGVLPPSFSLPNTGEAIQAFVPFAWTTDVLEEIEGDHNYFAIARLRPNVTLAQASAELNALQRAISVRTPDKVQLSATITPFQQYLTGVSRRSLLLLLAAVGSVLLIACVNIANLLLIRAIGNAHESAVRLALGGTRFVLFLNAFAEPFLLCVFSGLVAVPLAFLVLPVLLHNAPPGLPLLDDVSVNWAVLCFAAAVSLLAALVSGIIPSWVAALGDAEPALRSNRRTASKTRSANRMRAALIVAEVAGSLTLVVTAGLFSTSISRLLHTARGFDAEGTLSAKVVLPDKPFGEMAVRNAFYERALSQLRHLPGVESAGLISVLPLDGDYWGDFVSRIGDTRPLFDRPGAHFRWISSGYFEALKEPLVMGRFLEARDQGRRVAIISKRVADTVWPGENPIGQKFTRGNPDEPSFEVIGVVGDVRAIDLGEQPAPMVYVPYWYRSRETGSFVLRTGRDPEALIGAVRGALASINSEVAIPSIVPMTKVVHNSMAAKRFETNLLLGFALVAVLLAGIGIYGVVAYSALQRTQEIGIRMAIGAAKPDIYRLIFRGGLTPVIAGIVVGLGISWFVARAVAGLLYEADVYDPFVIGISALILLAAGLLACIHPAWRASRTEPVDALRHE